MVLPNTNAQSVDERRNEIVSSEDEFLKIKKYQEYSEFPEIKPYEENPKNIRFFPDGLEILVSTSPSHRFINGVISKQTTSPIDTSYDFQLIDEKRKKILEYSIDGPRE